MLGDKCITCFIVMERVQMTLHTYLARHPDLKLPKKLTIIWELIKILRFLKKTEFSHSDIKSDNILCNENGEALRLADFGLACSWANRYGKDSVRDGGNTKLQVWTSSKYHVSARNGTAKSDASVDQFSTSFLIMLILLGRTHKVFQLAILTKTVTLMNHFTSKLDQHIRPIVKHLKKCIEVDGAQLDLEALEGAVGSAKKGADTF